MTEFQHDHQQMAALLDLMAATNRAPDPQAIAAQALDWLIARSGVIAGAVWRDQAGYLVCLAQHKLDPDQILPDIQHAIAAGAPLTSAYRHDSWLAILPLTGAGQVVGALAAVTQASPDADDLLLRAAAAHLGGALAHARADLAATSDRVWEEFLSHAAHEIKNPLASIKGYADLLLRRAAKDPADPYHKGLSTISHQVGRTTALLEQLSDISRIAAGRLPIERRPGDFAALVERVAQEYQSAEDLHTISFHGGDTPMPSRFDELRMSQVVGAMLGNAIKFSPDGGVISVILRRSQAADGAPQALLSVKDTGVGVPEGEQERVFERFYRASNIRGSYSGMGVGLYIARAILDQHGGRIWLESQRGLGTTCFAALPLA